MRGTPLAFVLSLTMAAALSSCGGGDAVAAYGAEPGGPAVALSNADGRNAFTGVGRFRGRAACTAFLIDTGGGADTPAYALTNGHCATTFGSQEVAIGQPAPASYRMTFGVFSDTPDSRVEVGVRRIAFSTMKGTDLAVLELAAKRGDLQARGLTPLHLARRPSERNERLVVVGAPQSGVAGGDLQISACRQDAEGLTVLEYQWHWLDMERNGCLGIAPGSSGSPVLSKWSGFVVAILNTTTRGSSFVDDCFLNRPCEVLDGARALSLRDVNYAAPIAGLSACFDGAGAFDLRGSGCPLDAGAQITPLPGWAAYANPDLAEHVFGAPQRVWDIRISGPFARYAARVVPADEIARCRDPGRYPSPVTLRPNEIFAAPLPETEGRHALCLLGVDGFAGGDQNPRHPNVVTVTIDKTPPEGPAPFVVREGEDVWSIAWSFNPPEQSGVLYKAGLAASISCETGGYTLARVPFASVPFRSEEQRLCVVGFDSAGNRSRPVDRLLPPR